MTAVVDVQFLDVPTGCWRSTVTAVTARSLVHSTVDTNSLIQYLPRRSSMNCDPQFSNTDRQTDIYNYSIDRVYDHTIAVNKYSTYVRRMVLLLQMFRYEVDALHGSEELRRERGSVVAVVDDVVARSEHVRVAAHGVRSGVPRVLPKQLPEGVADLKDRNQFIGNLVGWIDIHNTIHAS